IRLPSQPRDAVRVPVGVIVAREGFMVKAVIPFFLGGWHHDDRRAGAARIIRCPDRERAPGSSPGDPPSHDTDRRVSRAGACGGGGRTLPPPRRGGSGEWPLLIGVKCGSSISAWPERCAPAWS